MRHTVALTLLAASLTTLPLLAGAAPIERGVPLAWKPCADAAHHALGSALECADMWAPADYQRNDSAVTRVELVRLRALDPSHREGSLFFNFGGPGISPVAGLVATADEWANRSVDDDVQGDFRRLAERYDLVAVVPRGLALGARLTCTPFPHDTWLDFTARQNDGNWKALVAAAREVVSHCAPLARQAGVGSDTYVQDIDLARRSLGEPRLNFYGASYGTWVGAWYAATFPNRTGRMVLDSMVDVTTTWQGILAQGPAAGQDFLLNVAIGPATLEPFVYGLGDDALAILTRILEMPLLARAAWMSRVESPSTLTAALTLADWVRTQPGATANPGVLVPLVHTHRFSPSPDADRRIRAEALKLLGIDDTFYEHTYAMDEASQDVEQAVFAAVMCGDTPWHGKIDDVERNAQLSLGVYATYGVDEIVHSLVCLLWPRSEKPVPTMEPRHIEPPFLIVQAEFDRRTPLSGTERVVARYENAYLVLAKGMIRHGILGTSRTPCVEMLAGRYLLTGELPATRRTECTHVPSEFSRPGVIPGPDNGSPSGKSPTDREL